MAGCIFALLFWLVVAIWELVFPKPPPEPKFKEITDEDIVI
jgi:hypothetical protein